MKKENLMEHIEQEFKVSKERKEIEKYLSVMEYSKEEISQLLTLIFYPYNLYPYYKEMINSYKNVIEKVN